MSLGSQEQRERVDSVLSFILIKKIITPVTKTEAYKLGLVDGKGKIIKSPLTEEEKSALTLFDKFIFKLKRMLGSRISQLNAFLYVHSSGNDFYQNLIVRGGLDRKAEVLRIKRDIDRITERYNCDMHDIFAELIYEEVSNTDKDGFILE